MSDEYNEYMKKATKSLKWVAVLLLIPICMAVTIAYPEHALQIIAAEIAIFSLYIIMLLHRVIDLLLLQRQ